jgi:hypothetical protein
MGRSDLESLEKQCTYSQQLVLAGVLVHFLALEATAWGLAGSVIARGYFVRDLVSQLEVSHDLILCSFVCGFGASTETIVHTQLSETYSDE